MANPGLRLRFARYPYARFLLKTAGSARAPATAGPFRASRDRRRLSGRINCPFILDYRLAGDRNAAFGFAGQHCWLTIVRFQPATSSATVRITSMRKPERIILPYQQLQNTAQPPGNAYRSCLSFDMSTTFVSGCAQQDPVMPGVPPSSRSLYCSSD